VYMPNSQRHTRSGAGRGVSQANGAAIHSKLPGLYQHEIFSGILKEWKQCWAVQASCGCLVGHVCMGVRISVLPHNFAKPVLKLDEYADGCRIQRGAAWYPFCLGGSTGRGVWGWVRGVRGVQPKKYTCLSKNKDASCRH